MSPWAPRTVGLLIGSRPPRRTLGPGRNLGYHPAHCPCFTPTHAEIEDHTDFKKEKTVQRYTAMQRV